MFFDETIIFRVRASEKIALYNFWEKHQEQYDNPSHVVRVALLQFLRRYGGENNGRKK